MLIALADAERELSALNRMSKNIPNVSLFVAMYVRKEALMSSQIEGTEATLEDILDPNIEKNANRDVADVVNYVQAVDFAIKRLDDLPICCRLIKETHAILMENTRGEDKCPGEFRRSQNWIGSAQSTISTASYIPPNVADMENAMSALEKYINYVPNDAGCAEENAHKENALIQCALIHYQFETIHPFLDGNGRTGRLLITLFLIERKLLCAPSLYISYYLKKNRVEYYDRMSEVRKSGNYEQWIKFFLRALAESAKNATQTIEKLTALQKENEAKIKTLGRSAKTALRVFEFLQANPIITVTKTAQALSLSFNTVSSAVKKLEDLDILHPISNVVRGRTFVYKAYLEILREGT